MKRIRKIADEFAREMKILHLPVEMEKLEEIARIKGWNIVPYSKGYSFIKSENLEKYCYTSKGFTYSSSNCTIIFIKDDLEYLDKINVICHEIGHIILKHIEIGTKQKNITVNGEKEIQEIEADMFALVLQSPTYLMRLLSITNTRSIVDMGILSKINAKIRYKYFFKDVYYYKVKFYLLSVITLSILVSFITYLITKNCFIANYKNNTQNLQTTATTTEISTAAESFTETTSYSNSKLGNEIVYITKSGSKYHDLSCYYIENKDVTAMTTDEAEHNGYTACSVCLK